MSDQHPDEGDGLLNFIALTVESMRDQMATKSDLARLEAKMDANFAAVRGDIEQVQLRVDSIDRAIRARLENMETEIVACAASSTCSSRTSPTCCGCWDSHHLPVKAPCERGTQSPRSPYLLANS